MAPARDESVSFFYAKHQTYCKKAKKLKPANF